MLEQSRPLLFFLFFSNLSYWLTNISKSWGRSWVDVCPITFKKGLTSLFLIPWVSCQHLFWLLILCHFTLGSSGPRPCAITLGFRDTVPSGHLRKSTRRQSCSYSLIQEIGGHVTVHTKRKGDTNKSTVTSPPKRHKLQHENKYLFLSGSSKHISSWSGRCSATDIFKIWCSLFPGHISSKTMKQHCKNLCSFCVQLYLAFLLQLYSVLGMGDITSPRELTHYHTDPREGLKFLSL